MGNFRPIPLKCWEAYLTLHGYTKNRISSSHHQWIKKGSRTIPVQGDEKQVPALHLKTGCFTMGIKLSALYAWADKNC